MRLRLRLREMNAATTDAVAYDGGRPLSCPA
jgi:hypothetical protein